VDIFVIVTTLVLITLSVVAVLPLLGFDIRIHGRSGVDAELSIPNPRKKPWIALALVTVSACFSAGALYYFFRPRIHETVVERPVEKLIEKQAPIPCPKRAPEQSKRSAPKTQAEQEPQPPIEQECGGGNCAASLGQQGGVTAGQINLGPPPVTFAYKVEDVASTKTKYAFEKKVSITTNRPFSPATLALFCDADVEEMEAGFSKLAMMNESEGVDRNNKKHVFIHFDTPAIEPNVPLVVRLWSNAKVTVTNIVEVAFRNN
jgi:hypothetical protein